MEFPVCPDPAPAVFSIWDMNPWIEVCSLSASRFFFKKVITVTIVDKYRQSNFFPYGANDTKTQLRELVVWICLWASERLGEYFFPFGLVHSSYLLSLLMNWWVRISGLPLPACRSCSKWAHLSELLSFSTVKYTTSLSYLGDQIWNFPLDWW